MVVIFLYVFLGLFFAYFSFIGIKTKLDNHRKVVIHPDHYEEYCSIKRDISILKARRWRDIDEDEELKMLKHLLPTIPKLSKKEFTKFQNDRRSKEQLKEILKEDYIE